MVVPVFEWEDQFGFYERRFGGPSIQADAEDSCCHPGIPVLEHGEVTLPQKQLKEKKWT